MNNYASEKRTIWQEYILEETPFEIILIPKNKSEIAEVENILLSYLKNISNPAIHSKIQSFAQLYLKEHYKKELKSRNWSRRMNAIYRIADFQISELVGNCEKAMKRENALEAFQLLKIYSILEKENFAQQLVSLEHSFSESEYKKLFSNLEVEMLKQLIDQMEDLKEEAQYALIDTMSLIGNMEIVEKLEKLLNHEHVEIRIRILKGLEKIGIIQNLDIYIPFEQSPVWEERLMVAKIFKNVPLKYTNASLERMLQDSNWWVRSQAAKTMIEHPDGRQKLELFIETATDQYAIDMANEVLKKRVRIG